MFRNEVLWIVVMVSLLTPSAAHAGGFALMEQSAEGMGFAYAGATAGYNDGSAVFFNPGSMSVTDKAIVNLGVSMVSPNANFSNEGSHMSSLVGGEPTAGDNGPNGGVLAWVPAAYYVQPLDEDFTFGFGVNSPFGLKTKYSHTWVGRYDAIKTELTTVSLSPGVSYKVIDNLSLGAAVNVLYADASLTNAVDFGTIGLSRLGPQAAPALGLTPQSADGFARFKGSDWGVGATVGLTYSYCGNSRIGLAYRSPIDMTLSGRATYDLPANAGLLDAAGAFADTRNSADLDLPDVISAGWRHEFDDRWALLADAAWTHWTRFNELRARFDNGQPDLVVDQGWDNVWRGSIGAEFKPTERLTLRTGFTYDSDPISDAQHRTPRIPGNDRYWLAAGAGYDFTKWLHADVGYAHLFVPDAHSDVISPTGDVLIGDWDLSIDLVSAQIIVSF